MKQILILLLLLTANAIKAEERKHFHFPIDSWSSERLKLFKENKFNDSKVDTDQFALQMLGCLASPNPTIRDDVGYMAFFTWLREGKLQQETQFALYTKLTQDIKNRVNDEHQVYLPFAILTFAEVLRVDRVSSYLTEQQLDSSIKLVAELLTSINDYRGFSGQYGWRHLIAHTADASLQLVLNKRLTSQQHDILLDSLFSQISPLQHSYVFGESKRLITPILYSWMANLHSIEQWQQRLDKLMSPSPFTSWQDVYKSEEGLHKLHNTKLFILELYKMLKTNDVERLNVLEPSVTEALALLR